MIGPNPCKDCTDRYLGCHDHCERHKEWSEQHQAELQHLKDQKSRWYIPYTAARVERDAYNIKHPLKGRKGGNQ